MSKVYSGPVFPVQNLTSQERADLRAELEWLEKDLARRRKKLAYWTMRKHHAETMPEIPEDLRASTLEFYEQSLHLVACGERVRAYLICDLQRLPEYADAYHHKH